jgi:hypothetical protein
MLNYTTIHATIGKGFADKQEELVFVSGDIVFTRRNMIEELDCANFIAAVRLAKVLRRLRIHTVKQLSKTDPYSLYRCKGIGDTAVYVAMCILDSHGVDINRWWGHKDAATKETSIRKAKRNKQPISE